MTSILWERLDTAGLDRATLAPDANGFRIAGTALFTHEGNSFDIRYSVLVDPDWNTRVVAAHLQGPDGERRLSLRVDESGRWTMGDEALEDAEGVNDVDFAFTPATNSLPLRRLKLAVGDEAELKVARIAFPERDIDVATQRYERLSDYTYRYIAADFEADLTVNDEGLVTNYPGKWRAITAP
ncbi:MAG: putative glycolipid-binding domain-containing protein [Acidimicrobiia bacterium]|nr:putative glycolipid-binding domain-containing protein [Acidimicrobiia bacterium]